MHAQLPSTAWRWIAVAVVGLVPACGEGMCAPGTSVACVGNGGCAGTQVCVADGTGLAPCHCAGDAGTDAGLRDLGIDAAPSDLGAADLGPDAADTEVGTDAGVDDGVLDSDVVDAPMISCPTVGTCDLTTNVGCAGGTACRFPAMSGGARATVCAAIGASPLGGACTTDADCVVGAGCDTDSVCRAYCCDLDFGSGCDPTVFCAVSLDGAGGAPTGVGLCASGDFVCDPIALTGCAGGEPSCCLMARPGGGGTVCVTSLGTTAVGDACSASCECADGLVCTSVGGTASVCRTICQPASPSCPGGTTCTADTTLDPYGVCV